jgi:hypothetical protein
VVRAGEFLFLQEGCRVVGRRRAYVWRSFFFRVQRISGRARASGEVDALCWLPRSRLRTRLRAPYHAGFLRWLERGATFLRDRWES